MKLEDLDPIEVHPVRLATYLDAYINSFKYMQDSKSNYKCPSCGAYITHDVLFANKLFMPSRSDLDRLIKHNQGCGYQQDIEAREELIEILESTEDYKK